MESPTVAEILRSELLRRQQRNSRFSLRAFAMLLKIDSGSLSQIMSEQRQVSSRTSAALLQTLGLVDAKREEVAVTLELVSRERRVLRQIAKAGVCPNSRHIARRLRMSIDQVNAVLTHLLSKGSIRMVSRKEWVINAVRQ